MLPLDETSWLLVELNSEDTEQVVGGASASYNTPGDPDYGSVPYSSGNKPVRE
jgi:hypothetical protein